MSEDVIDVPEFMERVQDDKELLLELLDIFVEDYKGKRAGLESAVETKNFDEVRSIAHSLKGASGNISAKRLRESFMKFEEMGQQEDLTGSDELIRTVDEQYAALERRMESLKKELKG